MTIGLSVGPFKNMTERASASRPFWPKDGHALTRTISRTSSGRISERRQKDEDPAAERRAQAHAAESESADRQAGPSSRHPQEEEKRATQAVPLTCRVAWQRGGSFQEAWSNHTQQFTGIDNLGFLPAFGKVTLVAGHQEIGAGRFSTLQKAVVRIMGGFTHQMRRSDQDAGAANERHEPVDFLETELQPAVEEYLFVFREDRLGNVKLDLAVQSQRHEQGFKPIAIQVCRHQNIGVENQADHLDRSLVDGGFCSRRTVATMRLTWPAVRLSAPVRLAVACMALNSSGAGAKVFI